jgi:hypothetical protein
MLSNELVAAIFGELQSTKDLYNVSCCSRRFYELAKPFLYAAFTMGWPRHATSYFLRTLLENPRLGTYVKRLELQGPGENAYYSPNLSFLSDELDEECGQLYENFRKQGFGVEFCEELQSKLLSDHNWEAVSGVLLLLCSVNLEEIEMEGDPSTRAFVTEVLRLAASGQRNGSGPAYFTKLRRFSIELDTTGGVLELLSYALEIKSILEFHVSGFVDNLSRHFFTDPSWELALEFTATSLRMLRCQLDSELLRTFLVRFHSLRSFEYHHLKDLYSTSNRHLCMLPEKVKEGINPSKTSLEKFILLHKSGPWPDFDALEDPIQPIGSLAEFEKLRIIVIDAELLIGGLDFYSDNINPNDTTDDDDPVLGTVHCENADMGLEDGHDEVLETSSVSERRSYTQEQRSNFLNCLPGSLEHLTIRNCNCAIFGCVSDLFLKVPGPPTKLKTLKVYVYFHFSSFTDVNSNSNF